MARPFLFVTHTPHLFKRSTSTFAKRSSPPAPIACAAAVSAAGAAQPASAYIHLPFCAQRCAYCSFTVLVSGRAALPDVRAASSDAVPLASHAAYVDLLRREIAAYFHLRPAQRTPSTSLRTLYFGGGTPSLMHPSLLASVFATLERHVGVAKGAEVTCEMDPATFTASDARQFAEVGVNRASIGAQSFSDELLALCGRIHRRADIGAAVDHVRAAGIPSVSLDLISALPRQSLAEWRHSLGEALALYPDHVSVYDLSIESGTRFGERYRPGVAPLPDEESATRMLCEAADVLGRAGFERYEVSNFARAGAGGRGGAARSRHNMAYWRNEPFYGFGIGATSYVDGHRFARPTRLHEYEAYVDALEAAAEDAGSAGTPGKGARAEVLYPGSTEQSRVERFEDLFINGMRLLTDGVRMRDVEEGFGEEFAERMEKGLGKCRSLVDGGLLRVDGDGRGEGTVIKLTERGALVENTVVAELLLEMLWRDEVVR